MSISSSGQCTYTKVNHENVTAKMSMFNSLSFKIHQMTNCCVNGFNVLCHYWIYYTTETLQYLDFQMWK